MKSKINNFQLCINFDEKLGKKENKKMNILIFRLRISV